MDLKKLGTQTPWESAAETVNSNNGKINEAITRLEFATYKNKGYYRTLEDLQSAIPMPGVGSLAYVGSTYPFTVYLWNGTSWENSGMTGGDPSVNLDNVYMKDDIVWLPQEDFDAMKESGALDPTKEYRTYEE